MDPVLVPVLILLLAQTSCLCGCSCALEIVVLLLRRSQRGLERSRVVFNTTGVLPNQLNQSQLWARLCFVGASSQEALPAERTVSLKW